MKYVLKTLTAGFLLQLLAMASLVSAQAAEEAAVPTATVSPAIRKTITENLQKSRPTLTVESVNPTPVDNLYAVKVVNGPTLFVTGDGRYFVLGDLYEITDQGYVNLAEQEREGARAEILAGVNTDDMIIFAPAEQPAKAVIMVFTDVDCYYCQKLHREVPDLNLIGIEVRYMAFPRAGIGSESYRKIVSAWCAKDRKSALTKLKNRESIPSNQCADNPVAEQFKLGNAVGVSGTPALITPDGKLMPGYVPALQLAKALGVEVDPQLAKDIAARHPVTPR